MKKQILLFALSLIVTVLVAFKPVYELQKSTADATQIQGVYIFFCSKPVTQTSFLGQVKLGMGAPSDSDERINVLIKKAKKDFPETEALVFNSVDMSVADAVKFK